MSPGSGVAAFANQYPGVKGSQAGNKHLIDGDHGGFSGPFDFHGHGNRDVVRRVLDSGGQLPPVTIVHLFGAQNVIRFRLRRALRISRNRKRADKLDAGQVGRQFRFARLVARLGFLLTGGRRPAGLGWTLGPTAGSHPANTSQTKHQAAVHGRLLQKMASDHNQHSNFRRGSRLEAILRQAVFPREPVACGISP